jgi:hypothetical protein
MNQVEKLSDGCLAIGIGKQNGKWYVQAIYENKNAEFIQEGLNLREYAVEVAKLYNSNYGIKVVVLSKERVFVDGYGLGFITDYSLYEDYPNFIDFSDENLHESDSSGYFTIDQIEFV